MAISYLFGPTADETPGEYHVRISDRGYDVDPVTRCQPLTTSEPIPDTWTRQIDWLRYEQDCFRRCSGMRDGLWDNVADLLLIGKPDHGTRLQIEEAIRLETTVSGQPIDEFELIDFVTMLKGF